MEHGRDMPRRTVNAYRLGLQHVLWVECAIIEREGIRQEEVKVNEEIASRRRVRHMSEKKKKQIMRGRVDTP